jgi:hypothetical protein
MLILAGALELSASVRLRRHHNPMRRFHASLRRRHVPKPGNELIANLRSQAHGVPRPKPSQT